MDATTPPPLHLPDETMDWIDSGLQYADRHDWIRWAWAILARAGDVGAVIDDDFEYSAQVITLAALGVVHDRFQDVQTGVDADHELRIDLCGGDRPAITEIELGRYCERHGHQDLDHFPESAAGLAEAAVFAMAAAVQARLCTLAGEARLFGSLAVAHRGPASIDPDPDADEGDFAPLGSSLALEAFDPYLDDVFGFSVTFDQHRAYEWLVGDLDLY